MVIIAKVSKGHKGYNSPSLKIIPSVCPSKPCTNSFTSKTKQFKYWGADNSLARLTSRCILFDGWNISFDASLVIYINSTNIPPIMIINRIYETQDLLSL
jgi:hypothetical protein